jgi:DNA-binding CsgD family transcriptional regulator
VARAAARGPLLEAARIARELGARPLLRELTNLASRALITLPGTEPAERAGALQPVMATDSAVAGAGSGAPDGARGRTSAGSRASGTHGEPISSRAAASPAEAQGAADAAATGIAAAFAPEDGKKRPKEAFGLSRREREVLALIAEGRTNREIGERLFISQKTVGVHVGNILAKLGASGRVEAAMVAIRLELVPTPLAGRPVLAPG